MTPQRLEQIAIRATALHSVVLGFGMLFIPVQLMGLVGWRYEGPLFYPTQSGIFLLILGGAYAAGLWYRPFVWLLVASKAAAVSFLVVSVVVRTGPPIILLLALVDGSMGLGVAALAVWHDRALRSPLRPGALGFARPLQRDASPGVQDG